MLFEFQIQLVKLLSLDEALLSLGAMVKSFLDNFLFARIFYFQSAADKGLN